MSYNTSTLHNYCVYQLKSIPPIDQATDIEEQLNGIMIFTVAAAVRNHASLTIKRLSSTVSTEANPVKLHAILTGPTGES